MLTCRYIDECNGVVVGGQGWLQWKCKSRWVGFYLWWGERAVGGGGVFFLDKGSVFSQCSWLGFRVENILFS